MKSWYSLNLERDAIELIESESFKPEPITSGSINKTIVKSNQIKSIRSRFKCWTHRDIYTKYRWLQPKRAGLQMA